MALPKGIKETPSSALSLSSSEGESFTVGVDSRERKAKGKERASEIEQGSRAASWIPAKSWVHFVAGGSGGLCGAIVTAPFDVAKTRLQSNLFGNHSSTLPNEIRQKQLPLHSKKGIFASTRRLLYHFVETGVLLRDISRNEGPSALFRGLGPTLVGVIPARSINFFSYGNGKQIYAQVLNDGKESTLIHLISAATAGIITASATNPIWVVKTRLQLQSPTSRRKPPTPSSSTNHRISRTSVPFSSVSSAARAQTADTLFTPSFNRSAFTVATSDHLTGSIQCIQNIWQREGLKGFYRGLSASYLGVAEGTIQWTLYERFKTLQKERRPQKENGWLDKVAPAGAAKLIATIITYPHEVVRTRLRQSPPTGWTKPKYYGLWQTFQLVWREEGMAALYGGLSPHLLRVVPNAAVMYTIYEMVLAYNKA